MKHSETQAFWRSLDWTKQDCVLARELGIPHARVHAARKRYGFRMAANHYARTAGMGPRPRTVSAIKYATAMRAEGCTFREIGESIGVTGEYGRQLCRKKIPV